jgi:hypothetical protein
VRVGGIEAPVEEFGMTAAMTPSLSPMGSIGGVPSVAALSAPASPAAFQAAAAPAAEASTPQGETAIMSAAESAHSPIAMAGETGIPAMKSRSAVRFAELRNFFSSREDAELSPMNSGFTSAVRPSLLARVGAHLPGAAVKTASGAGAILISQTPAWAAQTSSPSMSDPAVWPLIALAGLIAAGLVWAVGGFINSTIEVAAIDSAIFADTKRQKKALGMN